VELFHSVRRHGEEIGDEVTLGRTDLTKQPLQFMYAIASSKASPKPSEYDGNTNTWVSR
jgi:hypothetical protein